MKRNGVIRIGLVGCGFISDWHLRAYARIPEAEVVALCDRDAVRLDAAGDRYGIARRHSDLTGMLKTGGLDAVDLCTGPAGRPAIVEAIAAVGLPILVQKPLAESVVAAEAICTVVEAAGVALMVKENWRFQPAYQAMARALADGLIGEPKCFQIVRTCWGSPNPEWQVWNEQPYFRELAEAAWFDVGGHFVDTLRSLLGEPTMVFAEMARVSPFMRGEDVAHVVMRFNDCFATCHLSWAERGRPGRAAFDRARLDGTRGSVEIDDAGGVTYRDNFGGWRSLAAADAEGDLASHVASQLNFVRSLLGLEKMATPARHSARTLEIVLAAYESVRSRRNIDVSA